MHSLQMPSRTLGRIALALTCAATLVGAMPTRVRADADTFGTSKLYALAEDVDANAGEDPLDEGSVGALPGDGTSAPELSEGDGSLTPPDSASGETTDTGDTDQPQVPTDTSQDADVPDDGQQPDGTEPEDLNQELPQEDEGLESGSDAEDAAEQTELESLDAQAAELETKKETGAALPAGAVSVKKGTYYFETGLADNLVLGVTKRKGNVAICAYDYDASATNMQTWYVVKDDKTGWYHIYLQNADSGLMLGKHNRTSKAVLLYESKLDNIGDRALWAFVPEGSWYRLVNRSDSSCVLRFADGSTKSGSETSIAKAGSSGKKVFRFFLLPTKPKVSAGKEVTAGAYTVSPTSNANIAAETRGNSSKNNANVWLYTANGKNHQKLYLEADGSGYYVVWVVGTGKVLAQASDSVIPGNNVVQKSYSSSAATQKWALRTFSDGTYGLVNKATGLALGATGSSSGSNLAGTRNDGYKTTKFTLTRKALLSAGIVEIHPRTNSSVTLDVRGHSTGTAGLLLWDDTDALNQRFELVSAGKTDHWRIRTASSGGWITYMDSGDATVQQTGKGADAKTKANTWQVVYKGGWYSLINVASGKALDMRKGSTDSGTQIIAYKPNGKDSQHFTITSSSLIQPGYYSLQNGGERYLAVKNSSLKDGANIQVNDESHSVEQLFQFEQSGSKWSIQNALSELYLTLAQAEKGASVKQNAWTGAKKQLWQMQIADGGFVAIQSAADSSLGMVAYKAGASDGADVYVTTAAQSTAQSWKPVTYDEGELTKKQIAVIAAANRTPSPGAGYCAAWVTNVFDNAGIGWWGGNACDQYSSYCKSRNLDDLKPGMIVAVNSHSHTTAGSIYGHVGIYIGNGLVMDNVGDIRTSSLTWWIDYYSVTNPVKWGWFGKKALA